MKVKHFLNGVEHERIQHAIRSAEQNTSGDIVVYISRHKVEDPLAAAHEEFRKLGLETPAKRAGFLIFLAPRSRKFAVVGGTDLHAKVGQAWWGDLVALLARHFQAGHYTDGLEQAIERAARELKRHFPAGPVDRTGEKDIVEE